ncbi:MAG TPA: response regulator [Anaerolineales bacterium]|nr:response regulator [Anaerolineales bacterium]
MSERILIVDDDSDTLRLVGLMLQRQGYEVLSAGDGPQALDIAKKEIPDLVLLDIMMPVMDGYEVARHLRADPSTENIPIIMFTAKSQVDEKVMGFEVGADDYLTKPTQPRELFAHMRAVLSRSRKTQTALAAPIGERGYVIGVMAARGGMGVSTVALNLGITLRDTFDKEVVVAEFRPGQGMMSLELGYTKPEGLNRLLQSKVAEITTRRIEDELLTHASGIRLLLASYRPLDTRFTNHLENFESISRNLAYMARYVLLDLGSSISAITEKVIKQCDQVIVVTEPVPTTVQHTKSLLNDMIELGIGDGRVTVALINRARSGIQLSWGQVQEQLGHNIAVIFTPAPELAYQAAENNVPMVIQQPDGLTAQQFSKLAERIAQRSRQG